MSKDYTNCGHSIFSENVFQYKPLHVNILSIYTKNWEVLYLTDKIYLEFTERCYLISCTWKHSTLVHMRMILFYFDKILVHIMPYKMAERPIVLRNYGWDTLYIKWGTEISITTIFFSYLILFFVLGLMQKIGFSTLKPTYAGLSLWVWLELSFHSADNCCTESGTGQGSRVTVCFRNWTNRNGKWKRTAVRGDLGEHKRS